jgi:hypothetical protein
VTALEQHSVHADRAVRPAADIAGLARQAAWDIDEGLAANDNERIIAGCRRLIAIGGLAQLHANHLEKGTPA